MEIEHREKKIICYKFKVMTQNMIDECRLENYVDEKTMNYTTFPFFFLLPITLDFCHFVFFLL